jgi:glycerol-3-phosphate acyltransferase PlsX
VLKFYESVSGIVSDLVQREMIRCGADLDLERIIRPLDYAEYGGAPLLGVDGISIICHGSSSPYAIMNAIQMAIRSAEADLVGKMENELTVVMRSTAGGNESGFGHLAEGA